MDPNETIREMRELAHGISNTYGDEESLWAGKCLAEFFEDLDEWISKGGFLPRDWKQAQKEGSQWNSGL